MWEERGEEGDTTPPGRVRALACLHPWAPVSGRAGAQPRVWPLLTGSTQEKGVTPHRVPHSAEPQTGPWPPQNRPPQGSSSGSQTLFAHQGRVCARDLQTPYLARGLAGQLFPVGHPD